MNNKKKKIAINGFGRIGRLLLKMSLQDKNMEVVAVNDLGDIDNMAYLLKYDTAQPTFSKKISTEIISEDEKYLIVNNQKIRFFSIKNPLDLPWGELEIDVVAECTGVFASYDKSNMHLEAGAKKVVISGPVKEEQNYEVNENISGSTILIGINNIEAKDHTITSNASCTTNAAAVPLDILGQKLGIESALLTTIHSYTASQTIVDRAVRPGKTDYRRGRAGAMNIVPTSTGSAKQVGKVIEELSGNFDGVSIRVPTVAGSIADITFISKKETNVEEVNEILKQASQEKKYEGIFRTEDEQIVSSDIIGDTHAAIVDLNFTRVSGGNLVKIFVWYDNEAGYTNMLLKHIKEVSKNI